MTNEADAVWKKARRSGSASDNCVEIAHIDDGLIAIRDSKDRNGPSLRFSSTAWREFLDDLREAELGP
jgi:hypothetical protein